MGIAVSNASGYSTEAVAELVLLPLSLDLSFWKKKIKSIRLV